MSMSRIENRKRPVFKFVQRKFPAISIIRLNLLAYVNHRAMSLAYLQSFDENCEFPQLTDGSVGHLQSCDEICH